jgi:hypothetical protein
MVPDNNGHPTAWVICMEVGGYVCAAPDPSAFDGICGMPVESEPCHREHG